MSADAVPAGTQKVRRLMDAILQHTTLPDTALLGLQVPALVIVDGPVTMLDLDAPGAAGVDDDDGPAPGRVFAKGSHGSDDGGLLVVLTGGVISGLEYTWYADSLPVVLPEVSQRDFR